MQKQLEQALAALLLKITHGGIEGNPWCCAEVKNAAQVLADLLGHGDKFSVDLDGIAQRGAEVTRNRKAIEVYAKPNV